MSTSVILPDYITKSAEEIHKEMLEDVPDNINIIEGDILWDVTQPVANESARIRNIALKKLLYSRFPQTAEDEDLVLIGEDEGIYKKSADYAIHKIEFIGQEGTQISAGRIASTEATESVESIQFIINETVVIPTSGEITVNATCTVAGTIGNVALGNIKILSKSLNGITSLENIEIIKYGVDIEDTESYRKRILERMQNPITGGNKNHYEVWAKEVTGVGYAKCIPGAGEVRVVIADSNGNASTQELINEVYEHITSVRPLLAGTLIIVSVKEVSFNINAKIEISDGYDIGVIKSTFESLVSEYLTGIKFGLKASYAKIGSLLLDIDGVLDYSTLIINNGTASITLESDEVSKIGTVELEAA
ncbi:baseplate J/gp47 family protein [Clostridium butyricum]|uniref:baseplate J/gp47 family protein n=1 Tax=Clostridium butyricum TaxID=1492 RepID=UPI00374E6F3E